VRSHVFLCILAYHVEWHLRDALAPLLFHDTELTTARAQRPSPVTSTEPSDAAKTKKATRRYAGGCRAMGFAELIDHLGTLTRNAMQVSLRGTHRFNLYSNPTRLQEAAFRLLQLEPLACPVAENANRQLGESHQALASFINENFRLDGDHPHCQPGSERLSSPDA
jgi:hypothetical protein